MKAICQPSAMVMIGTMKGARIAPTLEPALKMPMASARSRRGNHSAVAARVQGNRPDSPSPMGMRTKVKPTVLVTKACAMCAMVQMVTAMVPPTLRAETVDDPAESDIAQAIGGLEPEHHIRHSRSRSSHRPSAAWA